MKNKEKEAKMTNSSKKDFLNSCWKLKQTRVEPRDANIQRVRLSPADRAGPGPALPFCRLFTTSRPYQGGTQITHTQGITQLTCKMWRLPPSN